MAKIIAFIPPNGSFKKQDFSLNRIAKALKYESDIYTILLHIPNKYGNTRYFNKVVEVKSQKELFKTLNHIKCDIIFSRAWMHTYSFSADLVKRFDNVVVNIKDWNFSTREEYKFLFGDDSDFDAIEYIFKNAKKILSHYTKPQVKIWAKKYNVDKDKFVFFPEYCIQEHFVKKRKIKQTNKIKLVYAGRISSASLPNQFFPNKNHLFSIQKLTNQKIYIDYVLPPQVYDSIIENKYHYLDFLYEDKFNPRFNIIKGKNLEPEALKKYHFGFFELYIDCKNEDLFKYAVVSKFAFYLEAGLPILVHKKFKAISSLVRKYNLGIVFDNKDLNNFENLFNIDEYNSFLDGIDDFRKKYVYTNINILDAINEK